MWIDASAVKCYDDYRKEIFDLHAMLVHTIQDMPALGNTSGQKTKGNAVFQKNSYGHTRSI